MKRFLPEDLEKDLSSVLFVAIVFFMLFKVCYRHLVPDAGNWPLRGAGICLAWMASIGMARGAALGLHLKAVATELFFPGRVVRRLDVFADLAFLAFAVFLLVVGTLAFFLALTTPERSIHLLTYAAIPVGSTLTVIRLLERLLAGGDGKEPEA